MCRGWVEQLCICSKGLCTSEHKSSSISSMSWKRVTMRCPSRLTGALKQHGAADVMNLSRKQLGSAA